MRMMMLLQQFSTAIVISSLLFCSLWVPSISFGVISTTQSVMVVVPSSSLCLSSTMDEDQLGTLEQCKSDLLRMCSSSSSPSLESVKKQVQQLEDEAELVGVGQLAMESGLLGGEWYESIN